MTVTRSDGAVQYTGQAIIPDLRPESDPWLETPDGEVVSLSPHLATLGRGACGDCRAGFFAPTDNGPTDQGVERCDECAVYGGDLGTALALAAIIGPDVSVWYDAAERVTES